MKTKIYSKLPSLISLPGVELRTDRPLNAKTIVDKNDNVNFEMYEIRPQSGDLLHACSEHNHIYYVLDGTCSIEVGGKTHKLKKDAVTAVPAGQAADIHAETDCRILVIRVEPSDVIPQHPIARTLSGILGTSRDVDWGRGHSRRFLIEGDGFNVSVHNTTCNPEWTSPLWYKNNYEAAYYVRADVMYTWDEGRSSQSFQQKSVSDGDGCLMLMDQYDKHELHAGSMECECICVFFPALHGSENHDWKTKQGGF